MVVALVLAMAAAGCTSTARQYTEITGRDATYCEAQCRCLPKETFEPPVCAPPR